MPKTGTTTARHVCAELGEGTSNFGRVHLTADNWREHIDRNWRANLGSFGWLRGFAQRSDVRVYGTIRDPRSWYSSTYRHLVRRHPEARVWLQDWTGDTGADYAQALRSWTRAGGVPWRRADELVNPDPGTGAPTLWTAALQYYYGAHVDGWVRLEHQAEDLARLLGVSEERVSEYAPRNVGAGGVAVPAAAEEWLECDVQRFRTIV